MFQKLVKKELGLEVVKEYMFHPTRKWRFDYAIPEHKLAIECDGGVWNYGRHNRAAGYINDLQKFNEAAVLGWRVLKFTPDTIYSVKTLNMIKEAINNGKV